MAKYTLLHLISVLRCSFLILSSIDNFLGTGGFLLLMHPCLTTGDLWESWESLLPSAIGKNRRKRLICSFTSSLFSACHDRKTHPPSLKAHCRMKYRPLFRTYHVTWKIDQYLVHFQLIFVLAFAVWSFAFLILKFCFLILTYLL